MSFVGTTSWSWGRIWARTGEVLREEGIRSLWFKILGETFYRRAFIYERTLREHGKRAAANLPTEVSRLDENQIGSYLQLRPDCEIEEVRRRLQLGHSCFVIFREGNPLCAAWAGGGNVHADYLDRELQLAAGEIYVYEIFTAPDYRGRHLSVAVTTEIARYFRQQACRRLLLMVMPENRSALAATAEWGFRRIGVMRCVKLGKWRRFFDRAEPGSTPLGRNAAYWDDVLERLDKQTHYLDPFLAQQKREENLRLAREWGGLRTDGRLLKTDTFEEAMGADAFLADLSDEVGQTIGIDVSAALTQRAAARFADRMVNFLAADVRRLPFRDACFSTIISPSTLDHFPDPADLGVSLKELFRVLEPGGRLVITLDNRQNVFDPILRLVHRLGLVPYYIGRSYTVDELRCELCDAGFTVHETTAILHNPRMVAVGAMRLVRFLSWQPLIDSVEKLLRSAQGLEETRWCYYSGSFVAGLAIRPVTETSIKKQA